MFTESGVRERNRLAVEAGAVSLAQGVETLTAATDRLARLATIA